MSSDVENPKNVDKGSHHEEKVSDETTWHIGLLHQVSVFIIVAGYCISASLLGLSIINKSTVTIYFTSAAAVLVCGSLNLVEHDRLDLLLTCRLFPAAVLFNLSQFTCIQLLLQANFDAFIVFRSSVPIFVAVAEALYSHKPWPAIKKWVSFATVFAGGVVYMMMMRDYQLTLVSYKWGLGYLITMSVYFVNYKHVCLTMGMNSWGLVLYNNLEALLLCPLELIIKEKITKIESDWHSFEVTLPFGLSFLFGLAICFLGFSFCRGRALMSITGFTVLGIASKLLTVGIYLVIWDNHSTLVGAAGIFFCMTGGVLCMQSVNNKPKRGKKQVDTQKEEEVKQKLLEILDS